MHFDVRLGYVSDLALQSSGGGSYAVNWHAYRQLQRHFDVAYCGPLVPVVGRAERMVSGLRRKVLRLPGRFPYFSPTTLERNARRVADALPGDCDAVVFRSAARWCRCSPKVPYFVYLDAVFHTFFHNTFQSRDFVKTDLERIWREEAEFLEDAAGVFFESAWGLEEARRVYGLRGGHYHALGRGGVIDPPERDERAGGPPVLVTMAMKFRQKGGHIVRAAFEQLKPKFPDLRWHIVGGEPDFDWRTVEGVSHEGVLRPDDPKDAKRLRDLLAQAFLLVHPTLEDTSPLVITEAAYFGCPAISVRSFAMPELMIDGQTGMLLDPPPEPDELADAIAGLLEDPVRYDAMRGAAREFALERFSWNRIGDRMAARIREVVVSA